MLMKYGSKRYHASHTLNHCMLLQKLLQLGLLASGMTNSDIFQDFPELLKEDISACLSYAAERERKIRVAS